MLDLDLSSEQKENADLNKIARRTRPMEGILETASNTSPTPA